MSAYSAVCFTKCTQPTNPPYQPFRPKQLSQPNCRQPPAVAGCWLAGHIVCHRAAHCAGSQQRTPTLRLHHSTTLYKPAASISITLFASRCVARAAAQKHPVSVAFPPPLILFPTLHHRHLTSLPTIDTPHLIGVACH